MRSKMFLMLTCVLMLALAGLASASTVLPEFQNKQQLAQWRANAEKTAAQDIVVKAPVATVFFTGKPYDAVSGNYVFKYRNYNPCLARWTSADPSGYPDGANNQAYAPRPNSELDPKGLLTITGLDTLDPKNLTDSKVIGNTTYTVTANKPVEIAGAKLTCKGYTFTVGNFSGTIDIRTYAAGIPADGQTGGIDDITLDVGGKDAGGNNLDLTGNRWIQIVTSNAGSPGHPAGVTFFDSGYGLLFYDDGGDADKTYFHDAPQRQISDVTAAKPVTWSASLYYVHVNDTAVTVYGGLSYGFTISE